MVQYSTGVLTNIFLGREEFLFKLGPFSWLNKKKMQLRADELLEETGIKIPDMSQPVMSMSGGSDNVWLSVERLVGAPS